MICPKCGAEYQEGFTRCSDCLVDLVEPGAQPERRFRAGRSAARRSSPIRCVSTSPRSGVACRSRESLLRSAGIPFVTSGEHVQQLTGLDVFGPARLYVSSDDADDARAVLADLDRQG